MHAAPNILLITCDQLRWDTLGFQGRFPVRTPTIDQLAREGVVFNNAYCAYPLCVPSRASITTGRLCYDHGVYYNATGWSDALPTLPGLLGANGYFSVAVGKLHYLPQNAHHGFHKHRASVLHYRDYLAAHGVADPDHRWPPGDGTPHVERRIRWEYALTDPGVPPEHDVTRYITNEALAELGLIQQRRETPPRGCEPFFMWLSYTKPHTPCDPPEPYASMYDPAELPPINRHPDEIGRFPGQMRRYMSHWQCLDDETILANRARYLGLVSLIDDQIARVIQRLEELGLRDSTLIVFSSDHGDYLGDHFCQQKSFFHDCSARVPLIFGGVNVAGGRVVNENCSHIDLMPTLLHAARLARPGNRDVLGEPIPPDSDFAPAQTLWPAVLGERGLDGDRVIVCESGVHGYSVMLKRGQAKYSFYEDTRELEVMDLSADPGELRGDVRPLSEVDLPGPIRGALGRTLGMAGRHSDRFWGPQDWQRVFS